MLPFVFVDGSMLGPFNTFGICFAVGALTWDSLVMWRARSLGYDTKQFRALSVWVMALGFLFSYLVDRAFYHPQAIGTVTGWRGFSSTGGFVGALIGALVWRYIDVTRLSRFRFSVKVRPRPAPLLAFTEVIVATYPICWAIGRLGCALIHDHPGIRASAAGSWLAVAWPTGPEDGVHHILGPIHVQFGSEPRYDLGLLEFFFLVALGLAFVATYKRRVPLGMYTAVGCLIYPPVRFALDFLRLPDDDVRHAGLTFAQWWSIAVFVTGLVMLVYARRIAAGGSSAPTARPPGAADDEATAGGASRLTA